MKKALKKDLIEMVSQRIPNLSYKKIEEIVTLFFDFIVLKAHLNEGVEIRNLGVFGPRSFYFEKKRNPRLNIVVEPKFSKKIFFKASAVLKREINA